MKHVDQYVRLFVSSSSGDLCSLLSDKSEARLPDDELSGASDLEITGLLSRNVRYKGSQLFEDLQTFCGNLNQIKAQYQLM